MVTQEEWLKETSGTLDLAEMDALVKESVQAWEVYEEKKKIASDFYNQAEAVDKKILTALKTAGKTKYHVDKVGTISIIQKLVVRVPASIEGKKKFFAYLRQLGEEQLFAMTTVNSNTLNAWYNSKLEEQAAKGILGFSVPGIEEPTMRESLRLQSVKGK